MVRPGQWRPASKTFEEFFFSVHLTQYQIISFCLMAYQLISCCLAAKKGLIGPPASPTLKGQERVSGM